MNWVLQISHKNKKHRENPYVEADKPSIFAKLESLNLPYESIFIAIVATVFLWLCLGPVLANTISHTYPTGYYAKDAYWHEAYSEYVYLNGSYTETPLFLSEGVPNLAPVQPPLMYYLVAYFSYLSGIAIYDSLMILVGLFLVLSCLVIYLIIKKINTKIAIFSLPLMVFSFTFPFNAGYLWGEHLFIAGMLFLFASIYIITANLNRNTYFLLAVAVAAIILMHTAELVYFAPICGIILLSLLFKKKLKQALGIVLASAIACIATISYLAIFYFVWLKDSGEKIMFNHIIIAGTFNRASVHFKHFGIWGYFIVAGIAIAAWMFITNKEKRDIIAIFLCLLAISFGTYLNILRIYQFRFLWPIMLALFFGIFVYTLFTKFARFANNFKKRLLILSMAISLALIIILSFTVYKKSFSGSVVDEIYWDSLSFLDNKMKQGEKMLAIDPTLSQEKVLWKVKKTTPELATSGSFIAKFNANDTSEIIEMLPVCELGEYTKKGVFGFVKSPEKISRCAQKNVSLCSYDYSFLNIRGTNEQFVIFVQSLFLKYGFQPIYSNNGVIILQNSFPREACGNA